MVALRVDSRHTLPAVLRGLAYNPATRGLWGSGTVQTMRCATLAIAALLTGCASKTETAWQVGHAIDGLQTLAIARDVNCYDEQNAVTRRLIGENPSEASVVAWWAGSAVLHAWVSRQLEPHPRWHFVWQSVSIVTKADAIVGNHRNGLRVVGDNNHSQLDGGCVSPDRP